MHKLKTLWRSALSPRVCEELETWIGVLLALGAAVLLFATLKAQAARADELVGATARVQVELPRQWRPARAAPRGTKRTSTRCSRPACHPRRRIGRRVMRRPMRRDMPIALTLPLHLDLAYARGSGVGDG